MFDEPLAHLMIVLVILPSILLGLLLVSHLLGRHGARVTHDTIQANLNDLIGISVPKSSPILGSGVASATSNASASFCFRLGDPCELSGRAFYKITESPNIEETSTDDGTEERTKHAQALEQVASLRFYS